MAFCVGNSPVTGEFPIQRPVMRSFDVFFDLDSWPNNGEAGDSRPRSLWRLCNARSDNVNKTTNFVLHTTNP